MPTKPQDVPVAPKAIRRVVVAGGGTAGWMAAAALSRTLGKHVEVTLVESEEIGTIGVGEATIPPLLRYHQLLKIGEPEFMAATQATIKLGINFEGWRVPDEAYFHSFGTTGQDHWSAGFQHFWRKGLDRGLAKDYAAYNVETRAAGEHRFAHLPRNGINYAYHLDAGLYARFLRTLSEAHGTRRVEGKIVDVRLDPEHGDIVSLQLDGGREIEGDLFIDCTGFRALLIGKALRVGFEDWSHWLFNDSAFAVQTPSIGPPVPYTRAMAGEAGWQWRIPLQHRVGNGIVFSSAYTDDDSARQALLDNLEADPATTPRLIRFRPGRRLKCWHRNCVALGLAASFIEPLESTTIHLMQRGIIRLIQSFPQTLQQSDIDEYNRQCAEEIRHIRDFVVLHFHVTDRRDTPYWRACADMEVPESLRHRIELFRTTGRVFHMPGELFAENSWIQVMLGQGILPQSHHPIADLMDDGELAHFLDTLRAEVDRTVGQLPAHVDYLQRYCPAKAP
ncbi:tryptophan halogenase family protein [Luteimonas abyssi]|uniref:tryptophan halogenase family protein n=1 Tax=Luteimonas abyssi TaxID=1247514 RepID=UPI000737B577|nr:tryptophan halogenase family protein [Luteimonas abyssi]